MFGFPFLTSLVVIVAMVVVFSFVINRGLDKTQRQKDQQAETASKNNGSHAA